MALDQRIACDRLVERDGEAAAKAGSAHWLCGHCWDKVRRDNRTVKQVVDSVLLYYDDSFGKTRCPCDDEDLRDLELLGLWSDGVTA